MAYNRKSSILPAISCISLSAREELYLFVQVIKY